jgi:CDP-2,3-bis-(O-geranylgeranyl)-sn-glycerol synthase
MTLVDPGALVLLIAANATPVILAGILGKRLDAPIDAGKRLRDGRPVLGPHKTWRGLVAGMLASTLAGWLLPAGVLVGLGVGAVSLAGDLASSFLKRRLRFESGRSSLLLDQLPESVLPLAVFAGALGLSPAAIAATAAAFTVLDLATAKVRAAVHRRGGG